MHSPINYDKDNTVNLLASLINAFSCLKSNHPELWSLPSSYIKNFDSVILFVIDWFAYHFLEKYFSNELGVYNHQVIHPIFPSATAPALTSLATWKTPQEHWLPWWYAYLKEIGVVTALLPFATRTWVELSIKTDCSYYYDTPSIHESSERENYYFNRFNLVTSEYSRAFSKHATRIWCSDFSDLCKKLKEVIKGSKNKKYCYCYDPDFDSLCHANWINSNQTKEYARHLFKCLDELVKEIEGTNTLLLLTADHWMIDSIPERNIKAEDYPEFVDMLSMPLTWETRAAFCHVKVDRGEEFEKWVWEHFSEYCDCYKSKDLLDNWWFWTWEIHKGFLDRIWDYILVMKENYILVDSVLGQERKPILWNHWWISREEIDIPLLWKVI